jgi:arylsulfatase A-like enzyme
MNTSLESAATSKPNILVIFGDDIGWFNVSSYSGDLTGVPTPNIDRIGKEGLRLTSFYAQPSCTAGRAAFITGITVTLYSIPFMAAPSRIRASPSALGSRVAAGCAVEKSRLSEFNWGLSKVSPWGKVSPSERYI